MGEIINLNRFRKRRDRAEDERRADENRVRFGRTRAERARDSDEPRRADRALDDKRLPAGRDDPTEPGPGGGSAA